MIEIVTAEIRRRAHRYAMAERFRRPEPLPFDDGCDPGAAPICPQPPSRLDNVTAPPRDVHPQDEDCLWLSVAAPRDARGLPVLVFFHGGGFSSGAGVLDWYDGSRLAAEHDVVVISVGYRVGVFGYLLHDGVSDGNLGLFDQLAALQWITRHAERLGGDPDEVTVFGQSAGGLSIDLMFALPAAERPFRRAVLQSAPLIFARRGADDARLDGATFHDAEPDPAHAPVDALLAAFGATARAHAERVGNPIDPPFVPVLGCDPVPANPVPTDLSGLDLLVGWNADDLRAFLPADEAAVWTARAFDEAWGERLPELAGAGAAVSTYRIEWRPTGSSYGAVHCLDLPLLLGSEAAWRDAPMLGDEPWSQIERFGRELRAVWAHFARTGEVSPALAPGVPVTWSAGGT